MIRIERDPAWWAEVASHPMCAAALMGLTPAQAAQHAVGPRMLPLASDNGGFLFGRMDAFGFVFELHTLYRPAGWGREAARAGKEALEHLFGRGAQVVVTHEAAANPLSRPPKSFGFTPAGGWRQTALGALRAWVLTKAAWEASAAGRRFQRKDMTCP